MGVTDRGVTPRLHEREHLRQLADKYCAEAVAGIPVDVVDARTAETWPHTLYLDRQLRRLQFLPCEQASRESTEQSLQPATPEVFRPPRGSLVADLACEGVSNRRGSTKFRPDSQRSADSEVGTANGFTVTACGEKRAVGRYTPSGLTNGKPSYSMANNSQVGVYWHDSGEWRLWIPGHKDDATLYTSARDTPTMPMHEWVAAAGRLPTLTIQMRSESQIARAKLVKPMSSPDYDCRNVRISSLRAIHLGSVIATMAPKLASISNCCIGVDVVHEPRIFFRFEDCAARDQFNLCLKMLRMPIDISVSV